MAHDDNDAGPIVEVILECAQCVEVKIVRWFVQQQHIGLFDESEHQLQTTTLATRQCANRCKLCIAVKPETLHQLKVFKRWCALVAGNGITNALAEIKVATQLVVVANLHGAANVDCAPGGSEAARNHVEQCALACAIWSHDS